MMKDQHSVKLTLGGVIGVGFIGAVVYYLLVHDELLPFSIGAVLSEIHFWFRDSQIVAIALLPVYLALIIFGTVALGLYFGSLIQHWVTEMIGHQRNN